MAVHLMHKNIGLPTPSEFLGEPLFENFPLNGKNIHQVQRPLQLPKFASHTMKFKIVMWSLLCLSPAHMSSSFKVHHFLIIGRICHNLIPFRMATLWHQSSRPATKSCFLLRREWPSPSVAVFARPMPLVTRLRWSMVHVTTMQCYRSAIICQRVTLWPDFRQKVLRKQPWDKS